MQVKILWADDEIDLLKPHILFLTQKGYEVETVRSGGEAIEKCEEESYDIVFLDENMPGISGLDALSKIKELKPLVPVVMITKSEEESIMEEAIGGKIADYLIKPVNPNQILLSLKRNLDQTKLVSEQVNTNYQREFRQIGMELGDSLSVDEWKSMYKRLVNWDLEFSKMEDQGMQEVFDMQLKEANSSFTKFIENNYLDWLNGVEEGPQFIHTLFKNRIAEHLEEQVYLIVIDNLRYDQYQVLRPVLSKYFSFEDEDIVFSILPTATQYARNSFFAGLLPSEIQKRYPNLWVREEDDGGKNNHEEELLQKQLERLGADKKIGYRKVTNLEAGKKLADNLSQLKNNDLNVIVYNFVDMLSHARTDMKVIKELADDEAAYRSLTASWFEHSPLQDILKEISKTGAKVVLTTDHGTVKVDNAIKVIGPKETNTNLRYKIGKNLNYKEKQVFEVKDPNEAFLPKENISDVYIFSRNNDFFVYPNNYNHFAKHYMDTFQHGGISMEEILIPYVEMRGKK
ncbi:two-component system response regulator [Brumimicrobium salinarum]|uniref:Two-component system response regulator n=1 Tax=Brumimicrobium salinarum TaxID=2058658 RepID=A0A2I0R084_9FLAO|nr:bifunctional response regulator/alkaline phosphatase family protein [Brumimicrobium salinarum]PKR80001.1 two-component system response regulator [Brumimicrobium salinarum]